MVAALQNPLIRIDASNIRLEECLDIGYDSSDVAQF